MLPTTFEIVKSALRADPSTTPRSRAVFLAYLKNGPQVEPPAQATGPRIVRRAFCADRLSCTTRTIDNLVKEGVLRKRILPGRTRAAGILESDLLALIGGQS